MGVSATYIAVAAVAAALAVVAVLAAIVYVQRRKRRREETTAAKKKEADTMWVNAVAEAQSGTIGDAAEVALNHCSSSTVRSPSSVVGGNVFSERVGSNSPSPGAHLQPAALDEQPHLPSALCEPHSAQSEGLCIPIAAPQLPLQEASRPRVAVFTNPLFFSGRDSTQLLADRMVAAADFQGGEIPHEVSYTSRGNNGAAPWWMWMERERK